MIDETQRCSFLAGHLCPHLTKDEFEDYDERAAIVEFHGGFSREFAERVAMKWVLEKRQ